MEADDPALMHLMRTIAAGDAASARQLLAASPSLAKARVAQGATRQGASGYFLDELGHYVYAGDTALHIAAAGYQQDLAQALVSAGADLGAKLATLSSDTDPSRDEGTVRPPMACAVDRSPCCARRWTSYCSPPSLYVVT